MCFQSLPFVAAEVYQVQFRLWSQAANYEILEWSSVHSQLLGLLLTANDGAFGRWPLLARRAWERSYDFSAHVDSSDLTHYSIHKEDDPGSTFHKPPFDNTLLGRQWAWYVQAYLQGPILLLMELSFLLDRCSNIFDGPWHQLHSFILADHYGVACWMAPLCAAMLPPAAAFDTWGHWAKHCGFDDNLFFSSSSSTLSRSTRAHVSHPLFWPTFLWMTLHCTAGHHGPCDSMKEMSTFGWHTGLWFEEKFKNEDSQLCEVL